MLNKLLQKVKQEEKARCEATAKKELEAILGTKLTPEIVKKLMDWKFKDI